MLKFSNSNKYQQAFLNLLQKVGLCKDEPRLAKVHLALSTWELKDRLINSKENFVDKREYS